MSDVDRFFESPILKSPYAIPTCHWELDDQGQPTTRLRMQGQRSRLRSGGIRTPHARYFKYSNPVRSRRPASPRERTCS